PSSVTVVDSIEGISLAVANRDDNNVTRLRWNGTTFAVEEDVGAFCHPTSVTSARFGLAGSQFLAVTGEALFAQCPALARAGAPSARGIEATGVLSLYTGCRPPCRKKWPDTDR